MYVRDANERAYSPAFVAISEWRMKILCCIVVLTAVGVTDPQYIVQQSTLLVHSECT